MTVCTCNATYGQAHAFGCLRSEGRAAMSGERTGLPRLSVREYEQRPGAFYIAVGSTGRWIIDDREQAERIVAVYNAAIPAPPDSETFCPCGCTDHYCDHSGFYVCPLCPPGCHGTEFPAPDSPPPSAAREGGFTGFPDGVADEPLESRRGEAVRLLRAGIEAFHFTREYIGEERLPEIEGWSWYDWCQKVRAFLAASGERTESEEQRRLDVLNDYFDYIDPPHPTEQEIADSRFHEKEQGR